MNFPHPETRMTSRVVFSFINSAASIKASDGGGGYLTAGLLATAIVLLSNDTAVASLLLKRRRSRSPNFSVGEG